MKPAMKTALSILIAVATASTVLSDERTDADRAAKLEFFEAKIRPVLVEHCYQCHSEQAKNVRGGLLLDSLEGVNQGGDSGAIVVPGDPGESLLLSSLKHESFEMPPDRKLPDHVIADFEQWVRDGAVDPRVGGKTLERHVLNIEEGRQFWCFQPIQQPAIPQDSGHGWAKSDIDRFLASRYEQARIAPAADASPSEIVRRLYFDLVGLPPSADQVLDFERAWQTDPDAAIAGVADELLASPGFGVRWGRHWLDATRFAESSGGGRSLMFPDAWRFRDYVIQSFNHDKPFDQLIREHIAGDLLPWKSAQQHDDQVTGVGYLTLGPTNYEQQDKELLRMEVVDEQVDTIGRTFLGLTLGCARCHDHKFDPVPTADYYALAGIFRSTETLTPGNVSGYVTTPLRAGDQAQKLDEWEQTRKSLQTEINQLKKQVTRSGPGVERNIDAASVEGIVVDDAQAIFEGQWTQSSFVAPFVGAGYQHDQAGKAGRRVRFEIPVREAGVYRVRLSHNYAASRCSRVPVAVQHAEGTSTVEIDQRQTPPDGVFAEIGEFRFDGQSPAVVSIDCEKSGPGVVIVDAVQFLKVPERSTKPDAAPQLAQQAAMSRRLAKLEGELKKHEREKPQVAQAMGVRDMPDPADWHIHVRGGIRNLGEIVPRGFLSVVDTKHSQTEGNRVQITEGQSGRKELADWVASPENPLTSRVFVNRVWLKLIGEGIVRTPDNFGKTGRLPTHPELLDYLASTFMQQDAWSVKHLIRRIVTSRVYRLSSSDDATTSGQDPDNMLLARGFRRRLEAEALRDAMLQISGELDLSVTGGRTIRKLTAYDNGYDHDDAQDNFRSIFVPFFRNSLPELFLAFDVANPNLVTGRRNVSTLPSQSLFLLNSPYVMARSEKAARHFLETQSADPEAVSSMIDQAWRTAVGRVATPQEREALLEFLNAQDHDSVEAWTSVFQALFGSMDFRYLD